VSVLFVAGAVPQASDTYIDGHLAAGQFSLTYPGVAYMIFRDYPLGRSPAIPNFTFEAWRSGAQVMVSNPNIPSAFGIWADSAAGDLNPVLCLLDYLTNEQYGCSIPIGRIDVPSFMDVAEYCSLVSLYGSPFISDRQSGLQHVEELLALFDGILTYWQGQFHLRVRDHWASSWPNGEGATTYGLASAEIANSIHPRRTARGCVAANSRLFAVTSMVNPTTTIETALLYYSTDGGKSWTGLGALESTVTWDESFNPDVIAGPDGLVHVAWVARRDDDFRWAVHYRALDPETLGWVTAIVDLTDDSGGANWLAGQKAQDVVLSVDGLGYLHAAIQCPTAEPGATPDQQELHYSWRDLNDPDPTAWSVPSRITDFADTADKAWADIVNDRNGICHISYVLITTWRDSRYRSGRLRQRSDGPGLGILHGMPRTFAAEVSVTGMPGPPNWNQDVNGECYFDMPMWQTVTVRLTVGNNKLDDYTYIGNFWVADPATEDPYLAGGASYSVRYVTFSRLTPTTVSETVAVVATGVDAGAYSAIALGGANMDLPMIVWCGTDTGTGWDESQVWYSERSGGTWTSKFLISDDAAMATAIQKQVDLCVDTSGRPTILWSGPGPSYATAQIWRRKRRDDGTWLVIRNCTLNPVANLVMPHTIWHQWMPVGYPLGLFYLDVASTIDPGRNVDFNDTNLPPPFPPATTVHGFWSADAVSWYSDSGWLDRYWVEITVQADTTAVLHYTQLPDALGNDYGGDAEFTIRAMDYIEGKPPVIARRGNRDTKNAYRVGYVDRSNDYNDAVAERQEDWSVIETGKRPEDIRLPAVTTAVVADKIASHLLMQNSFEGIGVTLTVGPRIAFLIPPAAVIMWEDPDYSDSPVRLRVASIQEEKAGIYALQCVEEP
jgi:hypothetical protein